MKSIPAFLSHLPIAENGYPVPFFTAWINGKPDFRAAEAGKRALSAIQKICWICGKRIRFPDLFCFIGGPHSLTNLIFGDGPMHKNCSQYSIETCPHLVIQTAKRRSLDLAEKGIVALPGEIVERPEQFAFIIAEKFAWEQKVPRHWYFTITKQDIASVTWYKEGKPMDLELSPQMNYAVNSARKNFIKAP